MKWTVYSDRWRRRRRKKGRRRIFSDYINYAVLFKKENSWIRTTISSYVRMISFLWNSFDLDIRSDPSAKRSIPPSQIDYTIKIKTGDLQGSGTDGPVYIKLFGGDKKQTDEILLSGSFQDNSLQTIQIKTIDIGKLQRILLRHEDTTKGWFIDYVEITVRDYLIRFFFPLSSLNRLKIISSDSLLIAG